MSDLIAEINRKLTFINTNFFPVTPAGLQNLYTGAQIVSTGQTYALSGLVNYNEFAATYGPTIPASIDELKIYALNSKQGIYAPVSSADITSLVSGAASAASSAAAAASSAGAIQVTVSVQNPLNTADVVMLGLNGQLQAVLNKCRIYSDLARQFDRFSKSNSASAVKCMNYALDPTTGLSTHSAAYVHKGACRLAPAGAKPKPSTDPAVDESVLAATPLYRYPNVLVQTNLFIYQRLLLMYELMGHIYVSLYMYNQAASANTATDGTVTPSQLAAQNMLSMTVGVLHDMNERANGDIGIKDLYKRMGSFNKTLGSLNTLSADIKSGKTAMTDNASMLVAQRSKVVKATRLQWGVFSVLIAMLVGQVLTLTLPIDHHNRLTVSVGILVVTVLVMSVLYFVSMASEREGFANSSVIASPSAFGQVVNASNIADFNNSYQQVINYELSTFLTNTISSGLVMQAYDGYGDLNFTLGKENSWFKDKNFQITNSSQKLHAAGRIVNLDEQGVFGRIFFMIAVSLIVAFAGSIYVLLPDSWEGSQTVTLVVAGLLIFVALYAYMYDITKRVRTDGSKIYFGKPNMRKV